MISTSDLKDRIELIATEKKPTGTGTEVRDVPIGGCWAKVEVKSSGLSEEATKEMNKVLLEVTVRFRPLFYHIKFIQFQGVTYRVSSIPPLNRSARWLTFGATSNET